MKTRLFVARAISYIVNLERYPNLIDEIFSNLASVSSSSMFDQNSMHGLLLVLHNVIERHDIFHSTNLVDFLKRFENIIANLKQ
jgi:hypothetical protein